MLEISEGHFVDLKGIDIKPANATKTISAFANASGGELYVGIEEIIDADGPRRVWCGFKNEEAANGLIQAIENLSPLGNHYMANFLSTDEAPGLVLQLTIFKSPDILYASNGKAYVRRSAQKLPVEGQQALERLRYDKGLVSFEDNLVDCDLQEITNSVAIIDFLIHVIPTAEPESWLTKQRLIRNGPNGRATVAGVLLFADEPQAILPTSTLLVLDAPWYPLE